MKESPTRKSPEWFETLRVSSGTGIALIMGSYYLRVWMFQMAADDVRWPVIMGAFATGMFLIGLWSRVEFFRLALFAVAPVAVGGLVFTLFARMKTLGVLLAVIGASIGATVGLSLSQLLIERLKERRAPARPG